MVMLLLAAMPVTARAGVTAAVTSTPARALMPTKPKKPVAAALIERFWADIGWSLTEKAEETREAGERRNSAPTRRFLPESPDSGATFSSLRRTARDEGAHAGLGVHHHPTAHPQHRCD